MHGEFCVSLHEDSLTSYTCYMIPCELSVSVHAADVDQFMPAWVHRAAPCVRASLHSDGNARIDSNPDTVHLWETGAKSRMPRS